MVPYELLPGGWLLHQLFQSPRQIIPSAWPKIPKLNDKIPRIRRLLLLLLRKHFVLIPTASRMDFDLLTRHLRPGCSHLTWSVKSSGAGESFAVIEIWIEERRSNELTRVAYVDQGQWGIVVPGLGEHILPAFGLITFPSAFLPVPLQTLP